MTSETDKGREALVGRLTCFAGITPSAPPPYEGNSFLNEHARGLIEEAIAALSTRTPSTGTGAREIVDALFVDLRDRRFLKYLFNEQPDICGAYGYIDTPLDLAVQEEIRAEWARIIAAALRSPGMGEADVERAARAMHLVGEDWDTKASFDSLPDYAQDHWRDLARAALSPATPKE